MRPLLSAALAFAIACSSSDGSFVGDERATGNGVPEFGADVDAAAPARVTVDVFPGPDQQDLVPQSFGPFDIEGGAPVDMRMGAVVDVTGIITSVAATPWLLAALPTRPGPAAAQVTLRKPGTIQSYSDVALTDGTYEMLAAPGAGYVLDIAPEDPTIPGTSLFFDLVGDREDQVLLYDGRSVWGTVVGPSAAPRAGVTLWLEQEGGARTATTTSREDGTFLLRVPPGQWTLVSSGAADGRDPTLRFPLALDTSDMEVDVVYPRRDARAVDGRVTGEDRAPIAGRVRFSAVSLDDFPADASLVVEVRTDARGNYFAQLLPGIWTREILPDVGERFAAPAPFTFDLAEGTSLASVELGAFTESALVIRDPFGAPVPGALLECVESGSGRRFAGVAGDEGLMSIVVPPGTLDCEVEPPVLREDLARTAVAWDGGPALTLAEGQLVAGTILRRGSGADVPVPFAVVEVHDPALSSAVPALSDEDGYFEVRLARP